MADTTDRASTAAQSGAETAAGAYPKDRRAPGSSYQPLSLLALIGFGVASVYAGVLFWLALEGLLSRQHFLLPTWSILVPMVSVGLCLIAQLQIRQSEGALAGGKLCRRGIGLCLLFGLGYYAYYAAVYVSIRKDADKYAREWIEQMKNDDVPRAFYRTMSPQARLGVNENEDDFFNKMLSIGRSWRGGTATMVDEMHGFAINEYVQMLARGGEGTTIELQGTKSFDYEHGGFRVVLRYLVKTELDHFYLLVGVHGSTAPNREYAGRRWRITLGDCGLDPTLPHEETPRGKSFAALRRSSGLFLQRWTGRLGRNEHNYPEAYLGRVPPSQRAKLQARIARRNCSSAFMGAAAWGALEMRELHNGRALLGGGLTAAAESELPTGLYAVLPGYLEFCNGEVYDGEKMRFYGLSPEREKIERAKLVRLIKSDFHPDKEDRDVRAQPTQSQAPEWEHDPETGLVTIRFPTSLAVTSADASWTVRSHVVVQGKLGETGPLPELTRSSMPDWRVERIRLLHAQQTGSNLTKKQGAEGS